MTIHVVQAEETISSIANFYQVSAERLIIENGISNPDNLVIGQTIVIVKPSISYTVKEGDTLAGIANDFNVSVMQLLRNNPYLSERKYIYPGETIVISYDTAKIGTMVTSGYAYSFINRDTLIKTLPFLTYLTMFNYRQLNNGDIVDIDDQEIINLAKSYGVAPIMLVSTQSAQGEGNFETARNLTVNSELQEYLMDNILEILERKGYYGLNQYFQFYSSDYADLYVKYVERLSKKIRSAGYKLLVTISLRQSSDDAGTTYEKIDYSSLLPYVDGLAFLSYNWGVSYGPPVSTTPVNLLKEAMEHIITTVPPEVILLGLPVIGYDYPLPYIPGYTIANAVTTGGAIQIAATEGVPIEYNEITQAPFFYYFTYGNNLHNVWFKDARSIEAISDLVPTFGLEGLTIWNIMYFFDQMWLVINNKYDIEKVYERETE